MFRSWQPLQTLSFFLFSSKLSSEYKRIFVGPFLEYEFIFQGFLALKSDKFRQISTFERRGCKSSLTGGDAYPSNLPYRRPATKLLASRPQRRTAEVSSRGRALTRLLLRPATRPPLQSCKQVPKENCGYRSLRRTAEISRGQAITRFLRRPATKFHTSRSKGRAGKDSRLVGESGWLK